MDLAEASTVTLGAIALQGVRRAFPTLGETFVVIGLGLLGQLTVQLLRANGCRVIGADPDRARVQQSLELGMDAALDPAGAGQDEAVARLTGGVGADGVVITAATQSDEVISTAFRMCRRKGRVVLVGDVGLDLDRNDMYVKELDFFISTSYGPGRYDARYEEEGLDYPIGYVRWTENRNMAEYLRLAAEGRVRVAPMIDARFPVAEAPAAFEALQADGVRPRIVVLDYPAERAAPVYRVQNPRAAPAAAGAIGVAVIGAGNFARAMHLPNLQQLAEYRLRAVVSRTGHNAAETARQFGAEYAATDYAEVLADPEVRAVLIATRPHLHAEQALQALQAGKHVLLEKPPATTPEALKSLRAFYDRAGEGTAPLLMTGFNRRFSPIARRIRELTAGRAGPMILNYRMNAGYIPLDNWAHGTENGGRNVAEACHIYDLFTFLTGSPVAEVTAQAVRPSTGHYSGRDNFVATMRFEDGSVGTLTYTSLGAREHPKERMDLFVDGKVLVLDDYLRLDVAGSRAGGVRHRIADKGQMEQLRVFARAVREGGEWPIPLWQQEQAMEIAFAVERFL
jgi:predicted dehydrogenase